MYLRKDQSSRSGRVKQQRLPSINAPTAATQLPFFSSGVLNASSIASSFTAKDSLPSFGQNFTFTTSPGPYPRLKSAPSLFDPFLNFPVEQQAYPSLISENAFLTLGISESLTIPILKQVPLRILISQQQVPLLYMIKSAQLFLQTPTEVLTETVLCLSSRKSRCRLRARASQLRQTKLGCIQMIRAIIIICTS